MTEVDKLYSLAGVEQHFAYLECHRGRSSVCCPIEEYEKDERCMGCINSSAMEEVYTYPPFTAEKQIAILQLLTNRKGYPDYETWGQHFDCFAQFYNFPDALAKMVNALWQDLTEAEQNEIREILE